MSGKSGDRVYFSPNHEFRVDRPEMLAGSRNVSDSMKPEVTIVNFSLDNAYWSAFGIYTVAWYKDIKNISKDNFITRSKANIEFIISNKYKSQGHFQLVKTGETTVNGNQALSFNATGDLDGIKATWQGDVINFGDRIAIVSMLVPDDADLPNPPSEIYEDFVNSLERTEN
jgi:hypothetical protein